MLLVRNQNQNFKRNFGITEIEVIIITIYLDAFFPETTFSKSVDTIA